jgi:hypothetical protein
MPSLAVGSTRRRLLIRWAKGQPVSDRPVRMIAHLEGVGRASVCRSARYGLRSLGLRRSDHDGHISATEAPLAHDHECSATEPPPKAA